MKSRLTDLCLMAMMGTVMVVSKEALAFLPNVELVSFSCCRECSTALAPGGLCTCILGRFWPCLPGSSDG